MNAELTVLPHEITDGEPSADLLVRSSSLKGCVIEGSLIPTLIDELPVIAVMALLRGKGPPSFGTPRELKVKESNRIDVMAEKSYCYGRPG